MQLHLIEQLHIYICDSFIQQKGKNNWVSFIEWHHEKQYTINCQTYEHNKQWML